MNRYRNVDSVVGGALKTRPDYLSSVEAHNSAGSSVTAAWGGHLPTLSAFASYGTSSDQFSRLWDNRTTTWGLQVSLPLFSGFRTDNLVQQAKVNERNALEQMKQAERKVQIDIRKAMLDFEAAQKQLDVTRKGVRSAQEDRRIAEEKYNLGAGTLLDLLIANANYVSALSNKVNGFYNYYFTKRQLEFSTGTLK
jgi:outer membrane protein